MKVYDRFDLIIIIDQPDVSTDRDVTVIARRGRQLPSEVFGDWMRFLAHIPVEDGPFMHAGFLIGR